MAALSPEEKKRMLLILTLLSQGQGGKNALAALQPLLQMYEQKQADLKAKKEKKRGELNAIGSQAGGLAGSLGGMYLIGKALAPAAATTAPAALTATAPAALTAAAPAAASGAATASATPAFTSIGQMVGNGLYTPAPASMTGGMSVAPAAASGFELGGIGTAGNYYLPALGAVGMTDLFARRRNNRTGYLEGAASGAALGSYFGPWGAAIGAGVGLGAAGLSGAFTSGKSKPQRNRDRLRKDLQDLGLADDKFQVTLADGSKYDIGKDGHTALTNMDNKSTRNAWDVDWQNPLAKFAVGKIDPRVREMYANDANKAGMNLEQYTGMLVNAATSNAKNEADVESNINAMFGQKPVGQAQQPSAPQVTAAPPPRPNSVGDLLQPPVPVQQVNVPPQAKSSFMATPQPQPAPAPTPVPAASTPQNPLSERSGPPVPKSPMPQQNVQQGLLALQQQLGINPQNSGNVNNIMDLIRAMGQRQNGAKA